RFYDRLPVHPPECSFRKAFGIPCLGCGGTRAVRAFVDGRLVDAVRFHPAAIAAIFASAAWAATGWWRYRSGSIPPPLPEQNRRIVRNTLLIVALLLLNWIYLLLFLP